MINKLNELENKIGYVFKDKQLLSTALTHSSYVNEIVTKKVDCYERLEFLGDAVLEQITSEFLYFNYPKLREGELSKLRSSIVCEYTLSKITRELGFGQCALFSKGERNTGGPDRESILCDMFESVLGAIYLDGGIEPAKKFVNTFLLTDIEDKQTFYDAKTRLQEYVQKNGKKLSYELIGESGPDHMKKFKVSCVIDGVEISTGEATSKKAAEQHAAYDALSKIS